MPTITLSALADSVNNTRFEWDTEQSKADMLAKPTPLLDNCRSMSKKSHNGGELIIEPHEFYTHSEPSRFTGAGFDLLDFTFNTIGYPARWEWADFCQPIGYSGHEKRINTGAAQIIDIIKQRQMNVRRHHDRLKQRALLIQDTPALQDIFPINGDDYADGALETAAPGAQANTYLNISKATFSDRPGWQNQYATAQNQFSVYGVTAARSIVSSAKRLGNAQGTLPAPKWVFYWSPDFYDNYDKETLLYKRFVNVKGGVDLVGGEHEMFGDVPVVQLRDDMPNTAAEWSAILLDHACFRYHVNEGLDTTQDDWHTLMAARQDAMVSLVRSMIQTSFGYLGTSGVVEAGDTY